MGTEEATDGITDFLRMKRELELSDELLKQSQRDNRDKYDEVENLKFYVKTLEHLLDKTLGDHWRLDHGINKPIPEPSNDSSTPLPPPVALRYSTSMVFSNRRPSQQRSRPVSHLKMRISQPLNGVHEMNVDDTPTGALKKLEGGAKRPLAPKRIYREESDSTVDKERQEPAEKNIQTIRTSPIPLPLSTSKKGQRSNEAVIDVLREVETRLGDRVATLQALKLEVRKKLRKQGSAD